MASHDPWSSYRLQALPRHLPTAPTAFPAPARPKVRTARAPTHHSLLGLLFQAKTEDRVPACPRPPLLLAPAPTGKGRLTVLEQARGQAVTPHTHTDSRRQAAGQAQGAPGRAAMAVVSGSYASLLPQGPWAPFENSDNMVLND